MRDLDELLDPVVSQRATEATHTPDFGAIERRGRQRRRRARAMAVGAVATLITAIAVGAQVASNRVDTAPAGPPPGFDDPDGRLARAVESGEVYPRSVVMADSGATLATWTLIVRSGDGDPLRSGFALAVDGHTYWSTMNYADVSASPLADDSFVVGVSEELGHNLKYSLVDENGVRPLVTAPPADVVDGSYEGFAMLSDMRHPQGAIFAVDVEASTATPVSELADITPFLPNPAELPQTNDGALWVIDLLPDGPRLIRLTSDGELSSYSLPPGSMRDDVTMSLRAVSASPDGRPILLWVDGRPGGEGGPQPPLTLRLSTVADESGMQTYDYPGGYRDRDEVSAATLPDGRLLINTGRSLLRTTDSTWQQASDVDLPSGLTQTDLQGLNLRPIHAATCLTPDNGIKVGKSGSVAYCTVDGESWDRLDLTP